VVNDGELDSQPDEVQVSLSAAPVAIAPNDTSVSIEETYLRLNGTRSYDPDGDDIVYHWLLLSAPPESDSLLIGGEESGLTSLKVDAEGLYVIELKVNDGLQFSLPDTAEVTVLGTYVKEGLYSGGDYEIFPNPSTGRLFIKTAGNRGIELVEVFDLQGRLLLQTRPHKGSPGTVEINLKESVNGSGLVVIKITGTERPEFRKILLVE
jgi:hypothetical protein